MKKLLTVILIVSILLATVACESAPAESETESESIELPLPTESESESETEPPETEPPIPDHTEVNCRSVKDWKDFGFTWEGSEQILVISLPADWTIEPYEADTYLLFCNGYEIGNISTSVPKPAVKKVVTDYFESGIYQLDYEVRLVTQGGGYVYRHVFACFLTTEEEDLRIFLEIDYDQLDATAAKYVAQSIGQGSRNDVPLRLSPIDNNGSNKILVIGNSFIYTSKIGTILEEWLKKEKTYTLEAVSIGMASVEDYTAAPWITKIHNGTYAAVFMCGFYGGNDVVQFQWAIDSCAVSNTDLIMFPAHNESKTRVPEARATYPDVYFLDWQGKINALIDGGVDYWDFCVNDTHKHSTPLAGYVGAHMIYTTLFGEAPPDYTGTAVSMSQVRQLLPSSFIEKGLAKGERSYDIYSLREGNSVPPSDEDDEVIFDDTLPNRGTIKCRAVTEWREIGLNWKNSTEVISLSLPADWVLCEYQPKTYRITCDGKEIGTVSTLVPTPEKRDAKKTRTSDGISMEYETHLVKTNASYVYRHVFSFSIKTVKEELQVFVSVDYDQLNADGISKIMSSMRKAGFRQGNFKIPLSQSGGADKIFIIGNSFVRTSAVGDFLENFIEKGNKNTEVVWESVSGAVARVYNEKKYLDPIRAGEYSVVFLCGLYYDEDIPIIGKYLEACQQSDTLLVVYPAHNERQPQIDKAKETYPTVFFMDWKEEINEIIATGVSFWEFCVDDAWHHSKPPAGYIGAHMIYTALFDEIPPEYTGEKITMKKLRTLIPEFYINSGFTPAERPITVYQLCK